MPKFSICLIARNEEKTLPRLLASLQEFKERNGEVVLLDTGSSDKTAEIAREWGCKVEEVGDRFVRYVDHQMAKRINREFKVFGDKDIVKEGDKNFDFSSARNYCASLASNDMVSMPDCDEIFTKLDIEAVDKYITDGFEQLEFNFVFAHGPNGEETIKFIQCKFYNRTKLKWVGIIHEVLQGEAKRTLMPESQFKIEHYQNESTDRKGYLVGLAIDCSENEENDRNSHYFARELMYRGFTNSAIKEFKRHLTISHWDAERSQSMIFIGDCCMTLGHWQEALEWYNKAYLECSNRREPLIRLGKFFFDKKDWAKAIFYLEGCLRIQYSGFYADNMSHYGDYPYGMLYVACWWIGDKEKGKEYFDIAVKLNPNNQTYQEEKKFFYPYDENLPIVSIVIPTLGREAGLIRCLDSIERLNYPKDKLEVIVMRDEPRMGVAKRLNEGFRKAKPTGWVVYGSNDIEFTPDSILNALNVAGNNALVCFNTGELLPDRGNICEHFMIRKQDVINSLNGQIFDEDFNHIGVDNLLFAKFDKMGLAIRAENAIVHHYHFSKGGKMDDIYKLGWGKVDEDRELLKSKLKDI